jgi:hypothetical protein
MFVNLGYNCDMPILFSEFKSISTFKQTFTDVGRFNTAAHQNVGNILSVLINPTLDEAFKFTIYCLKLIKNYKRYINATSATSPS